MNEESETRPYKELPMFDIHGRPDLSDGWDYARAATTLVPVRGGPITLPVGPGTFSLHFQIQDMIKTIEVKYRFKTGNEAEIQATEEGAPRYKIFAPEGYVIIPVGKVHEWVIHLPAETKVHAYIDRWQHDLEAMSRRARPKLTAEVMEEGRRLLDEVRKGRKG